MASGQIKKGAALSYAGVAFNAVAGLLYTPWMVDEIGTGDYGLYTLAMSVINFFLLDFGLGDTVSRFLSKYYAEGREDLANRFLGLVYKVYLVISACIAAVLLVVFLLIDQIYGSLTPDELATFKVLYVVVAAYSVLSFPFVSFNGVLVANERFVALNLANLLQKVVTVLLIVAALLLGAGVFALVAVNALVSLAFVLVKYLVIRKTTSVSPDFGRSGRGMVGEVLGFSFWAMVVQVCQRFIFSVMPTVLAAVSNSWEIAVFGLASSLEGYVWTVANALNGMFMPKVSRVLGGDEREGTLRDMVVRIGRIQLYIVGGIVAAFAAIGPRFVECWVGPEYTTLYACTLLLVAPAVLDLPLMTANTAIIASGEVRARGIVYMAMAVVNIALGFALSGLFGSVGACVSICVAYFVRTGGMCVMYRKKLGLRLFDFARGAYPRWTVAAVGAFALSLLVSGFLPFQGWPGFLTCALTFASAYCLLCWAVAFDAYERGLVLSMVGRLGKGRDGR